VSLTVSDDLDQAPTELKYSFHSLLRPTYFISGELNQLANVKQVGSPFERQRGRSASPTELTTSAFHVVMSHRVFNLVTSNSMLPYQLLVEFVKTVFEHQTLIRPVELVRFGFKVVADSSYKRVLCGLGKCEKEAWNT